MKRIFFACILSVVSLSVFAQGEVYSSSGKPIKKDRRTEREKGFDPTRLVFGGGLVFNIGGGVTDLGISPILGYKITDKFSAGIGLGYEYFKIKNFYEVSNPNNGLLEYYPFKVSVYTGSVWARYLIWNNIFAQVEPQMIVFKSSVPSYDYSLVPAPLVKKSEGFNVPRLLVGGGVRQPLGGRTALVVTLLYDVIRDKNSPYNGLDVRFGFNVGF